MSDSKIEIQTEQAEGILVISVSGGVHGLDVQEFHDKLLDAVAGCGKKVLLDLEKLSYINSAGLRSILIVAKKLRDERARFAICSLSGSVKGIFKISAFDKVIDVFESRSEAIDAIK